MFETLKMGNDHIYEATSLLQDTLVNYELVYRQTACEDAFVHCLNCVRLDIYETFGHAIYAVMLAVKCCRLARGPHVILRYILRVLFHAAH
ncbi:putative splicing factor 3B subunit 1 [Plasmopara halstedii]